MSEAWVNIYGYKGLYQVSSLGRVRSLPRKSAKGTLQGKIMSSEHRVRGKLLPQVCLYKNKKTRVIQVARLVAENFLPAPSNTRYAAHCTKCGERVILSPRIVVHKDGNPANNRSSNLEWGFVSAT